MTDSLPRRLEERWSSLELRATSAELISVELPTMTPHGALLAASDSAGRHLLVPLGGKGAKALSPDRRSRGVELVPRPVETDGSLRWYADLVCLDERLTAAFSAMCADVVVRVDLHPERAVATVRRVLTEWRELLRSGEEGLSANEIVGLFGEILVLEHLFEAGMDGVDAWVGGTGRRHDFRLAAAAIEVKATTAGDSNDVRIHGLDQLEPPAEGTLSLAFVRLEPVEKGGTSLQALVERVGAVVDDHAAFALKVRRAGYRDRHIERYRAAAYDIREERWYDVGTGFPGLVPAALAGGVAPDGVTGVDYTLDLAAAQSHISDRHTMVERFLRA